MIPRNGIVKWTRQERSNAAQPVRGSMDHVVILDGTLSSLDAGYETNAGLTYRLLLEEARKHRQSIYYEAGIQWQGWRRVNDVIQGRGINRQIRRAYGFLASRYRPGDRIFLFGYSRGAYAVRSLAGVIDSVGLLKPEHATVRNITQAYRHYQLTPSSDSAGLFAAMHCQQDVMVEMIGVWDTVKALGLRLPMLWMLTEPKHSFHNHQLGPKIRHGYQALALHETRAAFAPVLWDGPAEGEARVEQMWFRGAHGDIGGQLGNHQVARPLANIPLCWILEKAEGCGLALPVEWRARFECDPEAPMLGTWTDWGKLFLIRGRRKVGLQSSEAIHPTAAPLKKPGVFAGGFLFSRRT